MTREMSENTRKRHNRIMRELSLKKEAPKSAFILLVILYWIATFLTIIASQSRGSIHIFDNEVAYASFAGVFSSLSNLCVICLAVLFRKVGFITALVFQVLQFPMMIFNIFVRHVTTNLPGLFMNFFTIIAVIIIFISYRKVLQYQQSIREQAVIDRLTGLPNRFAVSELLEELVKRGERFAIVSIDIDDFRSINDTMGHDTGDAVLIEIANRWTKLADSMEGYRKVFVARLSGDEFMFVIGGFDNSDDIDTTIHTFEAELEKKMVIDDYDYYLTACYGYAEFPKDDDNIDALFLFADSALHEGKRRGGTNSVLRFSPDILNTEFVKETERKIRTALDNKTIFFHLQPQYDLSHKLRGFEALARMKDADGTFISPADFIPVAEKTGLIDRVDMRVFELSAEFLADVLRAKPDSDIIICVNVSVKHLLKNNFIEEIREILDRTKIPPHYIEIEITESIMIDSAEKALQRINEIKQMGMKVAIDDFGTGYSSLSYLNSFPSDMLKIDKCFIDQMNTSESSKQYVATIVSIGHVLNLSVISEGVEEQSQIDTLKEIGCDYVQGFLWGRPMPREEALEIIFK